MSQLTKKAIVEATMRLAHTHPLNKITVRDIVEECGITRNTFYYHFHDIYEVLEDAVDEGFERLKDSWKDSRVDALLSLIDFCEENKKIFVNLYKSIGHDIMVSYVRRQLREVLLDRLHALANGMEIEESDIQLISSFYEEAMVGVFITWLKKDGSRESPEERRAMIERIRVIFQGHERFCLENCRRKAAPKD